MTTTTFVDQETVIAASWLNDVNTVTYVGFVNVLTGSAPVVGNGIADDTAALEAIINASGGMTVILPPGINCLITSRLDITASVRILAYGATITEGAGFSGSHLINVDAERVTIEGLHLVGTTGTITGITSATDDAGGLVVRNCEVEGCLYGVVFNNNAGFLIEGSYLHDNEAYGIWCQNIADTRFLVNVKILDNVVDTSHKDPATSTTLCILVRGTATHSTSDVLVRGNRMIMPYDPTNSSALGCEMRYILGGRFSENYALDGAMAVSAAYSQNITIDGNNCYRQTFYAIELAASSPSTNSNNVVSDNVIIGGDIMNYGIGLQGDYTSHGVTITGNTIRGTVLYGIFMNQYWDNIVISSNAIEMDQAGSLYGIYLFGSTTGTSNVTVNGNTVDGRGNAARGIYARSISNLSITGNDISDCTAFGIYLEANTITMNVVAMTGNTIDTAITAGIGSTTSGGGAFGNNVTAFGNAGFKLTGTVGANILNLKIALYEAWGTGTPEAAVTAGVGSVFHRTDGGAGTCLYIKETGVGNTGWAAK